MEPLEAGVVEKERPSGRHPLPAKIPGLIAIYGKKRTGKTTVADFLTRHYAGVVQVAFSGPMIDELNRYLDGTGHQITDVNKADPRYRYLVQMWAQARRFEDPDYWNKRVLEAVRAKAATGVRLVVASGLREPEEKFAIERAGGEVWKVTRPGLEAGSEIVDVHYNELALDAMPDFEFNRVFVNDGSLLHLCRRVVADLES